MLTDTAALVVLAAVSRTQVAGGSPASIAAQIVLGLVVLVAFTLVALPRLARLRPGGADRAADGGMVRGMLAAPAGEMAALESRLAELQAAGYAAGVDVEARLLAHGALAPAVVNTAAESRAPLVILDAATAAGASPFGSDAEAVAAGLPMPVAVLLGSDAELREVEVVREAADRPGGGAFDADGLAIDLGRRIGGAAVEAGDLVPASLGAPRPGLLRIMPVTSWQLLAGTADPGASAAVLLLPDL